MRESTELHDAENPADINTDVDDAEKSDAATLALFDASALSDAGENDGVEMSDSAGAAQTSDAAGDSASVDDVEIYLDEMLGQPREDRREDPYHDPFLDVEPEMAPSSGPPVIL